MPELPCPGSQQPPRGPAATSSAGSGPRAGQLCLVRAVWCRRLREDFVHTKLCQNRPLELALLGRSMISVVSEPVLIKACQQPCCPVLPCESESDAPGLRGPGRCGASTALCPLTALSFVPSCHHPEPPWGQLLNPAQAQQGWDEPEQAGGKEQDPSSALTCAPSARLLGEGQAGHPDPATPALVMLIPQPTPSLFLAIFNLLLLTTRREKEDGVKRGRKPRGERSVVQLQQPGVPRHGSPWRRHPASNTGVRGSTHSSRREIIAAASPALRSVRSCQPPTPFICCSL